MRPSEHTSEKVENTLALLDTFEKVEAPPYFKSRVLARIENSADPSDASVWFRTQPKLALVGVILLLMINGLVLMNLGYQKTSSAAEDQDAFMTEYRLNVMNTYNL